MKKQTLYSLGIAAIMFSQLAPTEADAWSVTASGTIFSDVTGNGDEAGLFGAAGGSLIGDSYTETIISDPLLNSTISCATLSCFGTSGVNDPTTGDFAAPYTLITTVNGISFVHTESAPLWNYAMLLDALSANDTTSPVQFDALLQDTGSNGCDPSSGGVCISALIQAISTTTPFVPGLDFNQSITVAGGFNDTSNSYASFGLAGPAGAPSTAFYGSIDTLSVNVVSVPEPGTLPLLGVGFAAILLVRRTRYCTRKV